MAKFNLTWMIALLTCALLPANITGAEFLPFLSDGSLGAFNPSQNVLFNTDTGQFFIGNNILSGGEVLDMGANRRPDSIPAETMAFDFTSFNLPPGVTVNAVGSRPLSLL
jgi:hypothetical protein